MTPVSSLTEDVSRVWIVAPFPANLSGSEDRGGPTAACAAAFWLFRMVRMSLVCGPVDLRKGTCYGRNNF